MLFKTVNLLCIQSTKPIIEKDYETKHKMKKTHKNQSI